MVVISTAGFGHGSAGPAEMLQGFQAAFQGAGVVAAVAALATLLLIRGGTAQREVPVG